MSKKLHDLVKDFLPTSPEQWRMLAEQALRGADFDEALVKTTADGLNRGPVFFGNPDRPNDLAPGRAAGRPWNIHQIFNEKGLDSTNHAILNDLAGGVSQIGLVIDHSGQFGIAARTKSDWATLLDGVHLDIAPVFLEPGHSVDVAEFAAFLSEKGAKTGGLGLEARSSNLVPLARDFPDFVIASVDARCVHEAGGSEAQEIAYAASGFACAVGRLVESGVPADNAIRQVQVLMAADADIHLSICKIRAARTVLSSISAAYEGKSTFSIRVITSARMLTRQDPWTNIIRLTSSAFAAAVGGADTLTVLPPTYALGRPDWTARRIARNLHILLQEEAHIGLVSDPASGSYLHESLSQQLAESAWTLFRRTEENGKFEALVDTGFVDEVRSSADALLAHYRSGDAALVGVNRFAAPDLREMRYLKGTLPPPSDPAFEPIRLEDAASEGDAA